MGFHYRMSSAHRAVLLPHPVDGPGEPGGQPHVYVTTAISLAEFMMMNEKADGIEANFGTMFKSEPLPKNGYIELPDKPGFGLELNLNALKLKRPYNRSK